MTNLERLFAARAKHKDINTEKTLSEWDEYVPVFNKYHNIFEQHGPALVEALEEAIDNAVCLAQEDYDRLHKWQQLLATIEKEAGDDQD